MSQRAKTIHISKDRSLAGAVEAYYGKQNFKCHGLSNHNCQQYNYQNKIYLGNQIPNSYFNSVVNIEIYVSVQVSIFHFVHKSKLQFFPYHKFYDCPSFLPFFFFYVRGLQLRKAYDQNNIDCDQQMILKLFWGQQWSWHGILLRVFFISIIKQIYRLF